MKKKFLSLMMAAAVVATTSVSAFADTKDYEVSKGKEADVTRLMAVMGMGIKCGDEVTVSAEGADEEKAIEALKQFFEANL